MRARAMVVGAIATTLGLIAPAPPAGAVVTIHTQSDGSVTVQISDEADLAITCSDHQLMANDVTGGSCGGTSTLLVWGDEVGQAIDLTDLDGPDFQFLQQVYVTTREGDDVVHGSIRPEWMSMEEGDDSVILPAAGGKDTVFLSDGPGDGSEVGGTAEVEGTVDDDIIDVWAKSGFVDLDSTNGWTARVNNPTTFTLRGHDGDDRIDARRIEATSPLTTITFDGGAGDDALLAGARPSTLSGGPGRNTLQGGAAADVLITTSATDTIRGYGGADSIIDEGDGPIGGRTIVAPGSPDDSWTVRVRGDAALRLRAVGAGAATATGTLARTGRQELGPGVGEIV
ncbi:MAG TPA: hypothetical protein VGO60_15570, partial [Iamia sp.]|nr:hypothetical protein [Iamia sp.]